MLQLHKLELVNPSLTPSSDVIQFTSNYIWLPYRLSKRQSLSYSQDYVYPDDHAPPTYEMTPEFFIVYTVFVSKQSSNMLFIFILWPTPQLIHRFTHRRTITGRELCLLWLIFSMAIIQSFHCLGAMCKFLSVFLWFPNSHSRGHAMEKPEYVRGRHAISFSSLRV